MAPGLSIRGCSEAQPSSEPGHLRGSLHHSLEPRSGRWSEAGGGVTGRLGGQWGQVLGSSPPPARVGCSAHCGSTWASAAESRRRGEGRGKGAGSRKGTTLSSRRGKARAHCSPGVRCRLSSGRWADGAWGIGQEGVGTTNKLCFRLLSLGSLSAKPGFGCGHTRLQGAALPCGRTAWLREGLRRRAESPDSRASRSVRPRRPSAAAGGRLGSLEWSPHPR